MTDKQEFLNEMSQILKTLDLLMQFGKDAVKVESYADGNKFSYPLAWDLGVKEIKEIN